MNGAIADSPVEAVNTAGRRRRTGTVTEGLQQDIVLPHSEPFELYHNAFSMCSKKVRVCLSELGVAYRSHPIELIETGWYQTLSRSFLKVNPAGLVPVLVHDGHPVYESHAQIRYLAHHAGQASLFPTDPDERAVMEAWVDRASMQDAPPEGLDRSAGSCVAGLSTTLLAAMARDIPVARILPGLLFHPHPIRPLFFLASKTLGWRVVHRLPHLRRIVRESAAHLDLHLDALETQLANGGPYLQGDRFTLADVSWMALLDRLRELALVERFLDPVRRPHAAAYWTALQARPSYHEAIMAHSHPRVARGTARLRASRPRWMLDLLRAS